MTTTDRSWRRGAVVYQIYPRSFADSDGDGVGDIPGITERVDYIADLGVDVVWLCPVYESPQVDNGYDISDYRSIHGEYGTLADWERLRDALHERDVRLVMDLVVNHTSDEHEWFRRSRREEGEYADYYHWVEGSPDERPNNWESMFGGPAWSYDDEREAWYLHLFDERMPDLNWPNPAVRESLYEMIEWWLERGIDGFRLDVINLLSKAEGYPEGDPTADPVGGEYFLTGPRIHEYVGELVDRAFAGRDVVTIGETFDVTPADAHRFVVEDGLDMVFPFEHMDIDAGGSGPWDVVDWELADLKAVTERWQTAVGEGWIGLYLTNHDQPRIVSRFGDEAYRRESATMLATYLFTLCGTPFVYQGQELGMTNPDFESLEQYRDPATVDRVQRALATGDIELFEEISEAVNYWSRDNARTPMQWSDDEHAGFTAGEPWIKVNDNYPEINAEREAADDESVLAYYRRLIRFRNEHPLAVYGAYEPLLADHSQVFAYRRTSDGDGDSDALVVLLNFADEVVSVEVPPDAASGDTELLIGNYEGGSDGLAEPVDLRPYEARVYRVSSDRT
ncbi:alpha-glucosidase [Halosimplex aquaticum]|uniref:Alpha-glucosidase n=1 Tax=Halosimplex aquaticum TaxID=3026162 RepID=A0ABD5Y2F9_9EURY|nr:alpha-glucosidase [Halosimplex aquaticum]